MTASRSSLEVKTSSLILLAFSTLFFARPLDVLGAPEAINFGHFAFVPLVCLLALFKTRTRDRHQIDIIWMLLGGLGLMLGVMLASAVMNQAGIINVLINFLIMCEPFILLLGVVCLPIPPHRLHKISNWLIVFAAFNLLLALFQFYGLRTTNPDEIYGVFFSVAGATVSSIVSITFAAYYFVSVKTAPLLLRLGVVAIAIWQILISDTKLVLGSFLAGFLFLSLTKFSYRTIAYLIIGLILVFGVVWGVQNNLPFLDAYGLWIKPEYFSFDNEFTRAKFMAIRIIPNYYQSFIDGFLGLGPGHTVSRLGGWMLEKYWNILGPLGATRPFPGMPLEIMNRALEQSINVAGTAMFHPLFSWVGLWGDLGFVGLGAYLFLWFIVWKMLCLDDFSKFLVLATFATGFFPGYLEEPGSMLSTMFLIGIWWHEKRAANQPPPNPTAFVPIVYSNPNSEAISTNGNDKNSRLF